MQVKTVINSFFTSCTYVIKCTEKDGWIVDCGDVVPLMPILEGMQLGGVLLTHAHFDHIYGLNELLSRFPETFVYTNKSGAEALLNDKKNMSRYHETPFVFKYPYNIRIVDDGDEINLGNETKAHVVATPGHHPSCLTFIVGDAIFTGDAFIPGVKVVTNLPKGNKLLAEQSVELIKTLAIGKTIYPGHPIDNKTYD